MTQVLSELKVKTFQTDPALGTVFYIQLFSGVTHKLLFVSTQMFIQVHVNYTLLELY